MSQDNSSEEIMVDGFVNQIKNIFDKMPVMGDTAPDDRVAIREIGQQIYDSEIVRGMKKVAAKFAAEMPQHARRLDMLWDGVGSWMG